MNKFSYVKEIFHCATDSDRGKSLAYISILGTNNSSGSAFGFYTEPQYKYVGCAVDLNSWNWLTKFYFVWHCRTTAEQTSPPTTHSSLSVLVWLLLVRPSVRPPVCLSVSLRIWQFIISVSHLLHVEASIPPTHHRNYPVIGRQKRASL